MKQPPESDSRRAPVDHKRLVRCLLNNTLPSGIGAIVLCALFEPLQSIGRHDAAMVAAVGSGLCLGWWLGLAAATLVARNSDSANGKDHS